MSRPAAAAAEAALGLEVEVAMAEQQLDAARALMRKVSSDVSSLHAHGSYTHSIGASYVGLLAVF